MEKFLKQNCCHACHTKFAVFFSFPSCCVNSLILALPPACKVFVVDKSNNHLRVK